MQVARFSKRGEEQDGGHRPPLQEDGIDYEHEHE
jgi:hypothetical protein